MQIATNYQDSDVLYQVKVAVKGNTGLNLRLGPGTDFGVRMTVYNGSTEVYDVLEESEDENWVMLYRETDDGTPTFGWAFAEDLKVLEEQDDNRPMFFKVISFISELLGDLIPAFFIVLVIIYIFILFVGPPPGWVPGK